MNDRCPQIEDASGWVLGALDQPESDRYAAHIAGCEACRAEISELEPAAQMLALAVEQVAPPESLRESIMAVVESQAQLLAAAGPQADRPAAPRRRWLTGVRPVLGGGLAAGLLVLGIAAGVLIDGRDGDRAPTETFVGKAPAGMSAMATVNDDRVTLHFKGMGAPPAGRVYQVWLMRDGEATPSMALFDVPADGTTVVEVPEELDGADHVLVSDEPAGGSKGPTSAPSVDVALTS